ncbi:MAG TPA: DUF3147 family protein, partial [Candidatus Limnocylindria bacterium]|nr:DUF3147 family protein [Candidatus Limnocylindria bacterium]
ISKLKQNTALIAVPLTKRIIFVRSIIGGTIIALTVILAKTLGNSWGGLFATFPAAFTSTFLIYYLAHGKQVIASVGKSTFFPGAIGFSLYAVLAAFAFPKFGIWIGVLVPYIIIIPFYYFYTQLRTK